MPVSLEKPAAAPRAPRTVADFPPAVASVELGKRRPAFAFKVGETVEIRDWANNGRAALATIASRSKLRTLSTGQREPDGGPFYILEGATSIRADGCYREAELKAPEVLPVIFRAERSGDFKGDVTAVFPTLPHDTQGRNLTIYAHVGQHGGGSFTWYHATRAAKPDEFADLLRELRGIYESSFTEGDPVFLLQPFQRMTPAHRQAFDAEARRIRSL